MGEKNGVWADKYKLDILTRNKQVDCYVILDKLFNFYGL